eukprot:Ihof_evm6s171 gene=Ihof_evmTU6s171
MPQLLNTILGSSTVLIIVFFMGLVCGLSESSHSIEHRNVRKGKLNAVGSIVSFLEDRRTAQAAVRPPRPYDPDIQGACSDDRALNYAANATGLLDYYCMFPTVRMQANEWTSLPSFCHDANYFWDGADLATCYEDALSVIPPWPRHFKGPCKYPNNCTIPLTIEIINLMINRMEFDVPDNSLFLAVTYALRWKDNRIFGTTLQDPSVVWKPKIRVDPFISTRGDTQPLEVLQDNIISEDHMIYTVPPLCTDQQTQIQDDTEQDLGCCSSEEECKGNLQPLMPYIDCHSIDNCFVQWVERKEIRVRLNRLDMHDFPYDTHVMRANIYVQNPYSSTQRDWWSSFQPKPPQLVFQENEGFDVSPTTETLPSLEYSLDILDIKGFTLRASYSPITNTSLNYFIGLGSPHAYNAITSRPLSNGMGGVSIDIHIMREKAPILRYFAFPLILVGVTTCATPMLDDNAVNQVANRMGFAAIGILTTLVLINKLSAMVASKNQLTIIDILGIITIVFGGVVWVEALISYEWWRMKDCNSDKLWTCWFVRAMDKFTAASCVIVYLYLIGVVMLLPRESYVFIIWTVIGLFLSCGILAMVAYYLRKWSMHARIDPTEGQLVDTEG